MLTSFRVKNFKSLADTGELELRPLTLLIGPNSSGKSSLLQALLMVKQTMWSRDPENPLALDGPYTSLPPFPDLIFSKDTARALEFSLRMNIQARWLPPSATTEQKASGRLSVETRFRPEAQAMYRSRVSGELAGLAAGDRELVSLAWTQATALDGSTRVTVRVDDHEVPLLVDVANFRALGQSPWAFVPMHYLAKAPPAGAATGVAKKAWEALERYGYLLPQAMMNSLGEGLFYIGPLRESPHRYYEMSGEVPQDVGLKGERTVMVLRRAGRAPRDSQGVVSQVDRWFVELGIAARVQIDILTHPLYRVTVHDPHTGVAVNLADVGFGASQVLPVIVQGYFQPQGSMLLLEQPEIHLHARSQAILGDILMDIARQGRRLVVETHSQHMITRVQRRVAEGAFSRSDLALYYFEPTPGGTKIRDLQLDERGQFVPETLPAGFFMELYEDSSKLFDAAAARPRGTVGSAR